jgi:MFS family permease
VIIGGRLADWLQARHPSGRVMVVMLGLLSMLPSLITSYLADDFATFAVLSFITVMCYSSALGAAAAASQALVLPRMRGTATATFFIATTLVGLALGPFMAGWVSTRSGDNLAVGMLSTLAAAPVGIVLLLAALRLYPKAAASVAQRARTAGEAL